MEISIDCEGFIMQIYRWAGESSVIVTAVFCLFFINKFVPLLDP